MAIIVFGFALYLCPIKGAFFCLDDAFSIKNNPAIRQVNLPSIFNAFNTRFLVGLSFAVNYHWFALNPVGYRLFNFLVHCFNSFLVYLLIKSILTLLPEAKLKLVCRPEWVACLGALIFLTHPLQTEPVNYITQRFVLMGTFFYLLTLFLYIQFRVIKKTGYLLAGGVAAIAAGLCKEFAVTLPLMIALFEFFFLDFFSEAIWKRMAYLIPFFIIALIIPILLLRTPPEVVGVAAIADSNSIQEGYTQKVVKHMDITKALQGIDRRQYFLTELNVLRTYVRLLFLPFNQNFDYDYPVSKGMDEKTVISAVFLLCLLCVAAVTYTSCRIVSFSILWFFITLSVESTFIPLGHVIAEYRLYLASVGFVFLIMALICIKKDDQKLLLMIVTAILIGFSVLTYQRNKVWGDELTLWDDTIKKSPHKIKPYLSRGFYYFHQSRFAQALSDYGKMIEIDPNYPTAYRNRALVYIAEGKFTQAIVEFSRAIMIKKPTLPKNADLYGMRGSLYDQLGSHIQAISDYTHGIEMYPHWPEAYLKRGISYFEMGKFSQAIADFSKAIELNPDYAEAYNNRSFIYFQLKEYDHAWADVDKAEELGYAIVPEFMSDLKKASGKND